MKGDERILSLKQAPEGILLQFVLNLIYICEKIK